MPPSRDADSLSPQLAAWRVAPRSNPGFRTQVWARIEAARRPSTWTSFARAHPAVVSALLVAAILAGAWTGRTEARDHMRADQEAIAATYVHALDARWMRHP